ncbi:hypothetical protein [Aquimarina algiphila]|uniref:hypothetical protein n=1 Tax=Aquimarina algiphila TaxID=2047982 RepID=UPI00232F8BB1|nr:hypothetical protein [Aquimarina algiphila]
MKLRVSVKQMLVDLLSIQPQVMKLYRDNEKYQTLIQFLCAKDYYNDEDLLYPTLKEVEVGTGIASHKVRKQIKEIYNSFFDFETEYSFDFSSIEVWFNAEYYKRYASFKCLNLNYIPRVGENIDLPFLRAKVGTNYFYVKEIRHFFENNIQRVEIYLKPGSYNSYWQYRLDKALELKEIGYGEIYSLYEYQIKERLGLRN